MLISLSFCSILFVHPPRLWEQQDGDWMSLCLSFFLSWDLCYSYPSFRTSLIHMHIQCAVDNQVLSRHRARVHGEVLPASSVPFVDSSLMKMGIVLNYITEHKAVLQMKTFCAQINDDVFLFFSLENTILHQCLWCAILSKLWTHWCKLAILPCVFNHCSCQTAVPV